MTQATTTDRPSRKHRIRAAILAVTGAGYVAFVIADRAHVIDHFEVTWRVIAHAASTLF